MKKYSASISIYFTFAIVLIISVILSVTEIARINCQKLYLQIATDAGLDSMASLYHRKLYDYYNLYGVEFRTKEMLEEEYLTYVKPYFENEGQVINNWYVAKINVGNVDLKFETLIDDTYLEKEILNYTKYKLIGKTISFLGKQLSIDKEENINELVEAAKSVSEDNEKSSLYNEIHERYFNFSKSIKELEKYAKNIMQKVESTNKNIANVRSIGSEGNVSNAKKVLNKIEDVLSDLENLNDNLNSFKNEMDKFRSKVNSSYNLYLEDKTLKRYEFNDDICNFVESEFNEFLSYVDENSQMNKAVERGKSDIRKLEANVRIHKNEVNIYVRELETIESDLKEAKKAKGDDYDKDLIDSLNEEKKILQRDLSDYIKEIKLEFNDMAVEQIYIRISNGSNKSDENLIEKLIGFKNNLVLNLVLGSGERENLDENDIGLNNFDVLSKNKYISTEKLLFGEYELDKFNYYNKSLNDEITYSESRALEVERLIAGKTSDTKNLTDIIGRILLIRIGMNVLHIYKTPEKRMAARSFTGKIFGSFSPLLAETMFLLMITAWGTAQSISDVKKLLQNKKVNFMHTNKSWTISVESILNLASSTVFPNSDENDNDGLALSYKDYLRLLLLTVDQSVINGRMAGIIEYNIKKEQGSFDFSKLIYRFDVFNRFVCRHFFTNLTFVTAKDIRLFDEYAIKTEASRSFFDN